MTEFLHIPLLEWLGIIILVFIHEMGHGLMASVFNRYVRFGSLPKEERIQFNKVYNYERIKRLNLPGEKNEIEKITQWVVEKVFQTQKKVLYQDVKSTIENLAKMGKKLYILSGNHSDGIIELLKENQLLNYFEEIITVNKYNKLKADNFRILLDHTNASPKEIVHIGDDVITDGLGAKRFNIDAIIIRRESQLVYDNEQEQLFPVIASVEL